MKNADKSKDLSELDKLCVSVREYAVAADYDTCTEIICSAMSRFPHAPQPHNLLGIILEKTGDHVAAMKHFRAAWALDPTYLPADHNLNTYGTFFSRGGCAFDESDVPPAPKSNIKIEYDENGIGRTVRR